MTGADRSRRSKAKSACAAPEQLARPAFREPRPAFACSWQSVVAHPGIPLPCLARMRKREDPASGECLAGNKNGQHPPILSEDHVGDRTVAETGLKPHVVANHLRDQEGSRLSSLSN